MPQQRTPSPTCPFALERRVAECFREALWPEAVRVLPQVGGAVQVPHTDEQVCTFANGVPGTEIGQGLQQGKGPLANGAPGRAEMAR